MCDLGGVVHEQCGFAAGQRDAAAGVVVKRFIPGEQFNEFVRFVVFPDQRQRSRWAFVGAFAAEGALRAVNGRGGF